MSEDLEALLRRGLAERVEAAPAFDDPGLADAAIAGAGRIRRRRRVASAASGASLLVLGAAAFVWQPWITPEDPTDGVIAADTSTTEARDQLDMEFVVENDDGIVDVLNENGDRITIGNTPPTAVYRLADAYLAENAEEVWTVGLGGGEGTTYPRDAGVDSYTKINSAADQFAMVTPTTDLEQEEYHLFDVAASGEPEPVSFTADYDISIADWTETTVVFNADLFGPTNKGEAGTYHFNDEYQWGLETVAAAGFESVALVDYTDPSFLCVSDLDPESGLASESERCGPVDSADMREELAAASTDEAADPVSLTERADSLRQDVFLSDEMDLGEYQTRFYESTASGYWFDPHGLWEMAGVPGDSTWLLIEASGEEPELSELAPPAGALMPVLSYT